MNDQYSSDFVMFVMYCVVGIGIVWIISSFANHWFIKHRQRLSREAYERGYYTAFCALQKGARSEELLHKALIGGPWPREFDRGVRDAVYNHMGEKSLDVLLKEALIVARNKDEQH